MIAEIDRAREAGDTMGGSFEVIARGVPPGLGSYVQWDRKLDGRLAQAADVDSGDQGGRDRPRTGRRQRCPARASTTRSCRAPATARRSAASVRARPTTPAASKAASPTARTCASPVYMKPIATLMKPLRSVDLTTMAESPAAIERSDVCAVPAAAVVGEAMVAFVLADALLEKFGGDSIEELRANWQAFRDRTTARFAKA